jgi:hypothetical protein
VRIFLTGISANEPVFLAKAGAVINQVPTSLDFYHPLRLELWYNGAGTIRLDEDTLFNGCPSAESRGSGRQVSMIS